jgi:hypothetical protein
LLRKYLKRTANRQDMSKQQRGLGKGLGALLGGDADLSQIRKPVGYVNKEVVSTESHLSRERLTSCVSLWT